MATERVPAFVPRATCDHEPVRLGDGRVACIVCGYEWPLPKTVERLEHQLARAIGYGDHAAELILRGRIAAEPMGELEQRAAFGDR